MKTCFIIKAMSLGVLFVATIAMNILDATVPDEDMHQIPTTLKDLAKENAGELSLTRRITSVRPGDLMHVSFAIPENKTHIPDFSEIIAVVYSVKDGSLIHVLNKAPAKQVQGLHDAEFRGARSIPLYVPVEGLPVKRAFEMFKLALIAPEKDPSGTWTGYSADTMLFAYDGAS
ncbi:hypothetical protein GGI26_001354 [Coemansia sp. RSA 1358]|nr:hypothetical protein GGI26_001354 [Coemansia sp. RSA 1358]